MIRYNPEKNNKYPSNVSVKGRKMWYAVLAIATIALIALAAKHRDVLLQWLLPGDANVTETAMDGFIADIRNGMPGGEAVAAFCREIITYAAG